MIKKLRRKIILITMSIIGLVIIAFCSGISVYFTERSKSELYVSMESEIQRYNANPDQKKDDDRKEIGKDQPTRFAITDICVVEVSHNGDITTLSENSYISEDVLSEAVKDVLADKKKDGVLKTQGLVYSVGRGATSQYIAFAALNYIESECARIWLITLGCGFLLSAIVFALSIVLSGIAVKPVENSIEEQKRFIADASHELKTPLSVISANNKILLSEASEDGKEREWLISTDEEVRRMSAIIKDMLSLAHSESLKEEEKTSVDLSKTAQRICLQFEAVAYDKNVELDSDIQSGITFNASEELIKRLMGILLDNAVKYEPEGGRVSVKLSRQGGKIVFSVNNKGSVISKEDIPHVFERFYRADKSRSSEGAGLGLSIARSIAEIHKGTIKVFSDEENGTTFKAIF